MRISDWSSDVCSSDLRVPAGRTVLARGRFRRAPAQCLFLRHRELPPYDLQEHVRPAAGFDATATIERIDFDLGMFVPNVSDEVQLRITNEASVPKQENLHPACRSRNTPPPRGRLSPATSGTTSSRE